MDVRIIQSPSEGTFSILNRRKGSGPGHKIEVPGAIGLVQGKLIEMVCAADIAEKAVGVTVEDIRGSCPQNMIMLAIFGDMASVKAALDEIVRKDKEMGKQW
ncbi:BMC domain-containing protein [Granulicatella balaenopterae]|uniref:BMC domain-containing protein n=1 Tax=Granulicatella balaenopterae TaxID=137733 RepID=A0A1H9HB07_9LACT|nr:BMC domain-containing protein [Granulicatella balaenopterae]SEQ59502.1 BMC domain-containing protein [Granulicatella balaenopterae]